LTPEALNTRASQRTFSLGEFLSIRVEKGNGEGPDSAGSDTQPDQDEIDALRAAAAKLKAAGVQFSLVPALGIVMVRKDFAKEGRAILEEALLEQKKGSSRQPAVLRQLRCVSHVG
jgi:hypothetical protein